MIDKLIAYLEIARKYGQDVCPDHDIIYFCGPPEFPMAPDEQADCEKLLALNARRSSMGGWEKFV